MTAVRAVRIAGTAVLVLVLGFQLVNPRRPVVRNTPGFRDPVAAFELAGTPDDVLGILGPPGAPERAATVRGMVLGTRLDFLFLLAYPAFTAAIGFWRASPALARVIAALAVVMAIGDALENRELLHLAATTDPAAMVPALGRLRVFTLAKWGAVYAAAALLAVATARDGGWWRAIGVLFALAAACGLIAMVHLPAIEWGIGPLAVAWILTYLRAFRQPTA